MDRLEGVDAKVNALALKVAADIAELQTIVRRAGEDRTEDRLAVADLAAKLDALATAFERFESASSAIREEATTHRTHGISVKQAIVMGLGVAAAVVVPILVELLRHALAH